MLTLQEFLAKFPEFVWLTDQDFDQLILEAKAEMGIIIERWLDADTYKLAQGYLLAHLASAMERYQDGDHTPLQPVREKEVDDVRVEYAVSKELRNNLDPYAATSYGQRYIHWRRICFGGPRVV